MAPQQYMADIKAKLVASTAVATITIVEERLLPDRGYFRARLTLSNSDFLEVAEYFVVEAGRCMTRPLSLPMDGRSAVQAAEAMG